MGSIQVEHQICLRQIYASPNTNFLPFYVFWCCCFKFKLWMSIIKLTVSPFISPSCVFKQRLFLTLSFKGKEEQSMGMPLCSV